MSEHGGTAGQAPLVDVHAHFLTEDYVAAARAAGHDHPDGMPGWPSWSADEHLQLMTSGESRDRSCRSPHQACTSGTTRRRVRWLARSTTSAPRSLRPPPGGSGTSHPCRYPTSDGALDELTRTLDELGSDGVTVETNSGGVYLGDTRYAPLYEELNRRQAIVFVHPTSPPTAEQVALGRPRPMLEFIFDSTRAASDLIFTGTLTRYANINWVFTHGGGSLPLLLERMELFRRILDDDSQPAVQEQVARLWFDIAGTPFPRQVPTLVDAVGHDRLLYGSDYCWTPAAAVVQQLADIDNAPQLADDTWRALTTRNAQRLLAHD